ncbi:cytochrome c-type biogenesis protein CcmH [Couchioplanes caeruleus]|uniref:cytochrome c-type biogenesis protein CcmH n=1 Tax=Couchioplanes caeruleus TaxID=56438 RepID=UPI0020BE376F|nr:cytochrome c-type biogenesis protein CcmH [Couchioplanes caeruleus]UQU62627.1 cytochrome c-type biogenesis protein CcmH [Couchioplanes caeruleus]
MTPRRLFTLGLLVVLLGAAGTAVWRSAAPRPDTAHSIAQHLLCPACQGESVAQSQSPMAAAMRDTIDQQLAAGRTGEQIRQFFVDRYGPGVLAEPSYRGLGLLLWVLPALAVAVVVVLVLRRRRRPAGDRPGAAVEEAPPARRPARAWDAVAVAVIVLVAAVAVASPHRAADSRPVAAADPGTSLQALAQSLEGQGRYAEAAEVYRDVVTRSPDDRTRLKLAFALLRADRPADAAATAQQVLDDAPDSTEALLILGLAQRASGSPAATATLRRFLKAAPGDPAAAEVRRLMPAS